VNWFGSRKKAQAETLGEVHNRRDQIEYALTNNLPIFLARVSFLDTIDKPVTGKLPKGIENYQFVPLKRPHNSHIFDYDLPDWLDEPEKIGLQDFLGIGLARLNPKTGRGVLLAVSSAQADYNATVKVVQVQGIRKGREMGLHGGFIWQRSLWRAWVGVAQQTEASHLVMESSKYDYYAEKVGIESEGLDTTAYYPPDQCAAFTAKGQVILARNRDDIAIGLGIDPDNSGNYPLALR